MLVSTLFAFALAGAPAPQAVPQNTEVAPAIIEPRRGWGGVVPTDVQIANQLHTLLQEQPDKVICLRVIRTGARLPHEACRTLQGWYDFEAARDEEAQTTNIIAVIKHRPRGGDPVGARIGTPPHELVDMIKDRYRSPQVRALAAERAKARRSGPMRSPADPPVSNP